MNTTEIANNIKQIMSSYDNDFRLEAEYFNVTVDNPYSSTYIKNIGEYIIIGIDIILNVYNNNDYIIIVCYASEKQYNDEYLDFFADRREYQIVNNSIDISKVLDCINAAYNHVINNYEKYYNEHMLVKWI